MGKRLVLRSTLKSEFEAVQNPKKTNKSLKEVFVSSLRNLKEKL
jgi:hypothetical protein